MNALKHLRIYLLLCSVFVLQSHQGFAQSAPKTNTQQTIRERDGQKDFDFEIGTWKTHLKRLLNPLTGSTIAVFIIMRLHNHSA